MKHQLELKGLEPTPRVQSLIDSLDRKARWLPGDSLFLRCAVEDEPVNKLVRVTVTLTAPQKTLVAKAEASDVEAAIRSAFQKIEKQLEAYKSSLRGEHWWKRVQRRRELKWQLVGAAAQAVKEDPQWFFELVEPHLAKLREVAGRVLNYAEARSDVPSNDLELDDIVDAALARAHDEFSKETALGDIRSRLMSFALDEIMAEAKRAQADRTRTVHLEERVPKTPPTEEVSTLGDEILDFCQPDEELKVADIVPDLEIPPDQIAETEALRRCVREALGGLSRDRRRALTLSYSVGLQGKELAKYLGTPEDEVERLIEEAREDLREKLTASGCTFKTRDRPLVRR